MSANAIKSNGNTPYILNIPQYNKWTSVTPLAIAGNIDDIPTYSWYKLENMNNLELTGTITSTGTIITTTNLTTEEILELPNFTDLEFNNTNVLSMGSPHLSLDPITDEFTSISGVTVPNADIKLNYGGNDYSTVADSNGDFSFAVGSLIPIGTEISFIVNFAGSFLYRFRTVEVNFDGDLTITSATEIVTFEQTPFQSTPTLSRRAVPLQVVVFDARKAPTAWNLYASIDNQLTNSAGKVLTDGLVFVESTNMTVLSNTETIVYTSDGLNNGETTVSWPDEEGILLQLNIVPIVKDTTYRTNINWYVEKI